jgi:uncharacterized integral membrane protein
LGVEIMGSVIVVLWLIAWIWHIQETVETIKREQREEPFGSKRWHWPAVAFLGMLMIGLMLLRFTADSG